MATTLLNQKRAAINALKEKLLKVNAEKHPQQVMRITSSIQRLEKQIAKNHPSVVASEVNPSQITFQIDEVLKQLAAGVTVEQRRSLVDQIADLAEWGEVFPKGDNDAEMLLNKIVIAIETGDRVQRMAA